jgi:CheY-like chemotaxis protein
VFTNILLNAAHAITEVARASHRIRILARSDDEAIAVCISDTGPGIPSEVLGRIFDPFFTTKRPGVGTGLGLSISRSILRRVGGDLLVESVHGDGATFIALIPRPSRRDLYEAYRRTSSLSAPQSSPRPDKRVLIVDADERVLRAFARTLDTHYDVLLARDAEEAIELLESGSRADVIVAEVALPEASGLTLYSWLIKEGAKLAQSIIFVTAEEQQRPSPVAETGLPVLQKPVSRSDLLSAVNALLADHDARGASAHSAERPDLPAHER